MRGWSIPGVVPVHEVGQLADGRVYYVMKLVRGARLDECVRICETMSFAHAHGVVHRDLKPSNVMVGAFGEVLVLDWGIARVVEEREGGGGRGREGERAVLDSSRVDTRDGTVLGTPGFMSPEQTRGETAEVDARSDVSALGAILRQLVTGAASATRAPPALVSIWRKACAALPEDRYPSADALAADVTRFLDAEPVSAHREGWIERAHFEISADDPARAIEFYRTVFGWSFQKWEGPMPYWMVQTGNNGPGIDGGRRASCDEFVTRWSRPAEG